MRGGWRGNGWRNFPSRRTAAFRVGMAAADEHDDTRSSVIKGVVGGCGRMTQVPPTNEWIMVSLRFAGE